MLFPDPIAFSLFGWPIRWYGLCYLGGIAATWSYCSHVLTYFPRLTSQNLEDLASWSIIGIIVGGRLGYILLYAPLHYWYHPAEVFQIWRGGMAFHGGLLGVFLCAAFYSWRHKLSWREITDCLVVGTPLALFLGRLGNFINQEHCGRPTDKSWGVIFPQVDQLARHPSQLYEAFAEGLLLFCVMHFALTRFHMAQKPGKLFGVFLVGYGLARIICEFFRTPDQLWTLGSFSLTAGQLFSIPLLILGVVSWMTASVSSHAQPA